jgi:hypothetical protein
LGRPAKKKSYWEAKKRRAGELQAELEFQRKTPIDQRALMWIENSAKNVNPLQLVATAGIAYLIHNYILNSVELKQKIHAGDMAAWGAVLQKGAIEAVLSAGSLKLVDVVGKQDWAIWLVSVGIAYVIVTQGGAMMGLLEKGIAAIVPMFFGAAV